MDFKELLKSTIVKWKTTRKLQITLQNFMLSLEKQQLKNDL